MFSRSSRDEGNENDFPAAVEVETLLLSSPFTPQAVPFPWKLGDLRDAFLFPLGEAAARDRAICLLSVAHIMLRLLLSIISCRPGHPLHAEDGEGRRLRDIFHLQQLLLLDVLRVLLDSRDQGIESREVSLDMAALIDV